MDKFDRIYQLHNILSGRRTPISLAEITSRLECSRPTFYRLAREMRDYLGAPIELDPGTKGYYYAVSANGGTYELSGIWFSAQELQSLVVLQRLLSGLEPGLLEEQLSPLSRRLDKVVQHRRLQLGEAASRVRVISLAARPVGVSFRTDGLRTSAGIRSRWGASSSMAATTSRFRIVTRAS